LSTEHSDATLSELIDVAYACVSDPAKWSGFLVRLKEVTESDRAVLHNHWSIEGSSGGVIALGMEEGAMLAHRKHYWSVQPWAEAKRRLPSLPQVIFPHRVPEVPGSEYYHDWIRPWRVFDDACLNLEAPDGRPGPGLSVGYSDEGRLYTAEDERLFLSLVPHVSRALHLTRLFQKQRVLAEHAAYDASGVGIVELSPDLGIVEANATARRLLRLDGPGGVRSRRNLTGRSTAEMRFSNRATQESFRQAVADALNPKLGQRMRSWLRIVRSGQTDLAAFVVAETLGWFTDRALRLYVFDPRNGEGRSAETWRVLWHFTPTECRVGSDLVAGTTPSEIAERRSISIKAVRFHISSMLSKTGTRRQTELALLLSRSAHVNPPDPD